MANRCTLHKSKLESFKNFLDLNNIPFRAGKGVWQELQVFTNKHGWQCIYNRLDMKEHYTAQDKLMPIIKEFLDSQRITIGKNISL